MKRKLKIFTYGFYISMVVWECGLIASMIVVKVSLKKKLKKISQHRGKRNLKCALYK